MFQMPLYYKSTRDPPEDGAAGGEDDGEWQEEAQGEEEHVVGDIRGLQQHE